jgi:hypothetical protein
MNAYTLAHRGPSRSWVFSAADCLKYDAVALSVAVDAADDDGILQRLAVLQPTDYAGVGSVNQTCVIVCGAAVVRAHSCPVLLRSVLKPLF